MDTRGIDATFFIVKDMQRARNFYDALLEATPEPANDHWAEYQLANGTTFALGYHPTMEWRPGCGVLMGVADLNDAKRRAEAAGGTFTGVQFGGEKCKSLECIDTEGNALYLHQYAAR